MIQKCHQVGCRCMIDQFIAYIEALCSVIMSFLYKHHSKKKYVSLQSNGSIGNLRCSGKKLDLGGHQDVWHVKRETETYLGFF